MGGNWSWGDAGPAAGSDDCMETPKPKRQMRERYRANFKNKTTRIGETNLQAIIREAENKNGTTQRRINPTTKNGRTTWRTAR
jgi:hypothetical protein